MIQPHELVYGAIFEYNLGDKDFPEWELRTLNLDNIRECIECNDFHSYRPIPLTEKILVEWCGFESMNDSMGFRLQLDKEIAFRVYLANDNDGNEVWSHNNCDIFQRDSGDDFHQVCLNIIPLYLHQLQMLIQSLTNQPLKITLK